MQPVPDTSPNADPIIFTVQELKSLFFFLQENIPFDLHMTDYGKMLLGAAYCKIGETLTGVPCSEPNPNKINSGVYRQ